MITLAAALASEAAPLHVAPPVPPATFTPPQCPSICTDRGVWTECIIILSLGIPPDAPSSQFYRTRTRARVRTSGARANARARASARARAHTRTRAGTRTGARACTRARASRRSVVISRLQL